MKILNYLARLEEKKNPLRLPFNPELYSTGTVYQDANTVPFNLDLFSEPSSSDQHKKNGERRVPNTKIAPKFMANSRVENYLPNLNMRVTTSTFRNDFKSISNSPEKKDISPVRKEVKPEYPRPEESTDIESNIPPHSSLNHQSPISDFCRFLPRTNNGEHQLTSRPRTPKNDKRNSKIFPNSSYKTP